MLRATKYLLISAVVLFLAYVGLTILHDNRQLDTYARIPIGMPQIDVVRALGKPSWISKCTNSGTFTHNESKGCVEGYVYAAWIPLAPDYPTIWFDGDKRVIDKYRFVSP